MDCSLMCQKIKPQKEFRGFEPSESESSVTYFKDIKTKSGRDLKRIAQHGNIFFYLDYSFGGLNSWWAIVMMVYWHGGLMSWWANVMLG